LIKDFVLTRTTMSEVFTDFAKFQIDAAAKGDDEEDDNVEVSNQINASVTIQATGMQKIDKEQKMRVQGDLIQSENFPRQ